MFHYQPPMFEFLMYLTSEDKIYKTDSKFSVVLEEMGQG